MKESPQILVKAYDYLLYLIPQVAKFPRNQRYLLGERLETLSTALAPSQYQAGTSALSCPFVQGHETFQSASL